MGQNTPAPDAWNANNLGNKVVTSIINWRERCITAWGSEWAAPDKGVYEWSNGRKMDSTDRTNSGIYGP